MQIKQNQSYFGVICTFTVAALLCALVSWVAVALEGAFCVDAAAISTQSNVRTLVNVYREEFFLCK